MQVGCPEELAEPGDTASQERQGRTPAPPPPSCFLPTLGQQLSAWLLSAPHLPGLGTLPPLSAGVGLCPGGGLCTSRRLWVISVTLGQPAGGSAGTIHAPSSKELTGSGRWRRPHGCGGLQAPRDGRCAGSAGQWGRGCSSLPCTQEAPLQLDLAPASGTGPCGLRSTDALGVTLRFWWAWPCRVFSRKPESAPRPLPAKERAAPGCQRLLVPRLLPVNTLVPRLPPAASWALAMTRSARAGGRATSWGWRGGLRSFGQAAVFCFLQFLMFTWFSRSFQGFFWGGRGLPKEGACRRRGAPGWPLAGRC